MEPLNDHILSKSELYQDPMKHVLTVIEKKVRNLEKRKVKLDGYRKILSEGGILDRDQEIAINKYNEVVGSINFAKELLHGFNFFTEEVTKNKQKHDRREQNFKDAFGKEITQFLVKAFQILKLLSNNETVRMDLQKQDNKILTKEECELLVQFYETCVIQQTPSKGFLESLGNTGNHLYLTFDASNSYVCGTTYRCIRQYVDCLMNSEYFKNLSLSIETSECIHESPDKMSVNTVSVENCCDAVEKNGTSLKEAFCDPLQSVSCESSSRADLHADVIFNKQNPLSVEDLLAEVTGQYDFFQESLIVNRDSKTWQVPTGIKPLHENTIYESSLAVMKTTIPNGLEQQSEQDSDQRSQILTETHIPLPHEKLSGYEGFKSKFCTDGMACPAPKGADGGNAGHPSTDTAKEKQSDESDFLSRSDIAPAVSNQVSGNSSSQSFHTKNCHPPNSTTNRQYGKFEKNFYLKDTYQNLDQFSSAYPSGPVFKAAGGVGISEAQGHHPVPSSIKEDLSYNCLAYGTHSST